MNISGLGHVLPAASCTKGPAILNWLKPGNTTDNVTARFPLHFGNSSNLP